MTSNVSIFLTSSPPSFYLVKVLELNFHYSNLSSSQYRRLYNPDGGGGGGGNQDDTSTLSPIKENGSYPISVISPHHCSLLALAYITSQNSGQFLHVNQLVSLHFSLQIPRGLVCSYKIPDQAKAGLLMLTLP